MYRLFFFLAIVLLSGCAVDKALLDAKQLDSSKPYPKSVEFYHNKAISHEGYNKASYQLKYAGRLLQEGMTLRAQQVLAELTSLPPTLRDEKILLKAYVFLQKGLPRRAAISLSQVRYDLLTDTELKKYYYELYAKVSYKQGLLSEAIDKRLALNNLYQHQDKRLANYRSIWLMLNDSSVSFIEKELNKQGISENSRSWLSLNKIIREQSFDTKRLKYAINQWESTYPNSSARAILPKTMSGSISDELQAKKQIALFLPLSGPYSGPGNALRDGYMSAYYQQSPQNMSVRFYDTNGADITTLYRKAISKGADFVIGPLLKREVKLLGQIDLPVPTLVLNSSQKNTKKNLYEFAISPQEEVSELAFKAYQDGHRRALIISPKGNWGDSVTHSLEQAWAFSGGTVTAKLAFDEQTSMNAAIQNLLQIDESRQKYQDIKRYLGEKITHIARRRQDFDIIFLVAYPSMARQIRPLLRYYYAGNIPIYSPSVVYSGFPNAHTDRDLNGIIFADMPYLVDTGSQLVKRIWPEQFNSYNRLFAVGNDAFVLSRDFIRLRSFPLLGMFSRSGVLYLDGAGKIHRQLSWMEFDKGKPVRIE